MDLEPALKRLVFLRDRNPHIRYHLVKVLRTNGTSGYIVRSDRGLVQMWPMKHKTWVMADLFMLGLS